MLSPMFPARSKQRPGFWAVLNKPPFFCPVWLLLLLCRELAVDCLALFGGTHRMRNLEESLFWEIFYRREVEGSAAG